METVKHSMKKFTAFGRHYEVDEFGVIHQTDSRPFKYDPDYSAIYDKPEYQRQSDILMAMRYAYCVASLGRDVRSIIDVGYGNGAFMKFAKQHVKYTAGMDVTGVPVPPGCIQLDINQWQRADVGTFWDVLEHIHDLNFLYTIPVNVLVVSLPYCHFHTEGVRWMEEEYKHLKPDEHVRHFNAASLEKMMQVYGWEKISSSTHEDIVRKSAHGLQNILTMSFRRKR